MSHPFFGRARNAFSIIELLVVVFIIALIVGISFPVIMRVQKAARQYRCAASLRQVGMALSMYCSDNESILPVVNRNVFGNGYDGYWYYHVARYVSESGETGFNLAKSVFNDRLITCQEKVYHVKKFGVVNSYAFGMNWRLGPGSFWTQWRNVSSFKVTSVFALTEGGTYAPGLTSPEMDTSLLLSPDGGNWHGNGNNFLYLDGHVSLFAQVSRLLAPPFSAGASEDMWNASP